MSKTICYHHNDLDGVAAAALVKYFIIDKMTEEDFICCNHSDPIPTDIAKGKIVYIVDYSFGKNEIEYFKEIILNAEKVIHIDHHKTSIDLENSNDVYKNLDGIRDTSMSGAALVYRYFRRINDLENMPLWIQYVSDFDTWTHKFKPISSYFNLGMQSHLNPTDRIYTDFMYGSFNYGMVDNIINYGKVISEYNENRYKKNIDNAYEVTVDDKYKALVLNTTDFGSNIFGDKIKEYDMCMVWRRVKDKYLYSVYSEKEYIDCAKLCEKFGGGGHKGAAGFTSDHVVF